MWPGALNLCMCVHLSCACDWAPASLSLSVLCFMFVGCRSRLADYMVNCWVTPHAVSTCPNQDNHQACLGSYARLIGQYNQGCGWHCDRVSVSVFVCVWGRQGNGGRHIEMRIYLQIPQFLLKFQIHAEIKSNGYRQRDSSLLPSLLSWGAGRGERLSICSLLTWYLPQHTEHQPTTRSN